MITQADQDRLAQQAMRDDSHHVNHGADMLADLIKAAMERGMDVPKIIGNILRQKGKGDL